MQGERSNSVLSSRPTATGNTQIEAKKMIHSQQYNAFYQCGVSAKPVDAVRLDAATLIFAALLGVNVNVRRRRRLVVPASASFAASTRSYHPFF
jgi:hypothetical protein